jgi:glycosidase
VKPAAPPGRAPGRGARIATAFFLLAATAQAHTGRHAADTDIAHVPWSRSANIYEVNLRQYTPQGTLSAFSASLPRLRKMGVDIIWLMPVQPIGKLNRKGTLGSYYAVSDYTAVNPEFGSIEDLRTVVRQAHALGMHVILDWVANHTAWDHPWVAAHPDWYKKNEKGEIYPVTFTSGPQPEYWTDVVALDYASAALQSAMIGAMAYWVREADIDGFRCDVAFLVPTAFWDRARRELDAIKPVFMLAEAAAPGLHAHAFDMTYGWDLSNVLRAIARGKGDARSLRDWFLHPAQVYPRSAYRMQFTNNHDYDSWDGSDAELYGPAFKAMAVLAATLPGMPLIYGGQEAGLDKRLAFFEKDPIDWKQFELAGFYRDLLQLKTAQPALWNGQYGGTLDVLDTGNDGVFAFQRRRAGSVVTVAVNVSGLEQRFALAGLAPRTLGPWEWSIATP